MSTLNIELSSGHADFVRERVSSGEYLSPSDYIRHLIDEDQRRMARALIEAKLQEAMEAPSEPWTKDSLEKLVAGIRRVHPSVPE